MMRNAISNLDDLQRKEEDHHKKTWNTRKKIIYELFKIHEQNQQIINDITQDDQSEYLGDESNNMEEA